MALVGDVLVVVSLLLLTLAVWGVWRMPDLLTQMHAASLISTVAVAPALAAAVITVGGPSWIRALLVLVLLALTVPVAGHVVAQAARVRAARGGNDPPPSR